MKQVTGGIVKWFHPQHGVKKNKPKKKKKPHSSSQFILSLLEIITGFEQAALRKLLVS
jgi:hypothetical protein